MNLSHMKILQTLELLGGKPFDIYLTNTTDSQKIRQKYPEYHALVFEPFLRACINRYGFHRVTLWNFEYWMYYNSSFSQINAPEVYCRQFSVFHHAVKNFLPDAKVGGPGFNLFLSVEILQNTLSVLNEENIIPDFITVLFYPYAMHDEQQDENNFHFRLISVYFWMYFTSK